MGHLAIPLMIASTAVSTLGSFNQARAERGQLAFQSKVAKNNAIIAQNNAEYEEARAKDAVERGQEDVRDLNRRIAAVRENQREAFAGAGVVVDTGSPLDTLVDTEYLGRIDVDNTLANANREASGYQNNAANLRNESNVSLAQSSMFQSAKKGVSPFMRAAGTALAGASNVAGKWESGGGS